jgi:peptidase E
MPLLGASAGLNVMANDIRTTNDMHIAVQELADGSLVSRLDALGVLPAHISVNPHYIEKVVVSDEDRKRAIEINANLGIMLDHQGEPRETRLKEVIEMDPGRVIIALREGPYLVISGQSMQLKGETGGLIFKYDREPLEIASGDELSHLLTI